MEKNNYTDYSVLMSVYAKEQPEYLQMSIDSMLQQTCPTNDFVLVCDGKLTEILYGVIDEYREKYSDIFHVVQLDKNVGLAEALNAGLPKCKNDIVARMDSDDVSYPERCELQIKVMNSQRVDLVGSNINEFVDDPEKIISSRVVPCTHKEIVKYSKKRNPFNHPSVMYRKSKVLAVGGYENYLFFEDYYLWVKMIRAGYKTYNITKSLVNMRVGAGLYNRRGGIKYIRCMVRFRRKLLREHYITIFEFGVIMVGHIGISMMPNKLRKYIYILLLRK